MFPLRVDSRGSAVSVMLACSRCLAVLVAIAWGAATLSGCAVQGAYVWVQEMPAAGIQPAETIIKEGDVISVRVFGQDQISTRGRVRPDGMFVVPLLGEAQAGGRSPGAFSGELQEKLKAYVTAPNVTVTIEESQIRVDVTGEVRRPGTVPLETPYRVLSAIASAGGLTEFAKDDRIFVLRADKTGTIRRIRFRYEALTQGEPRAAAFRLQSGDVLVVE